MPLPEGLMRLKMREVPVRYMVMFLMDASTVKLKSFVPEFLFTWRTVTWRIRESEKKLKSTKVGQSKELEEV